jgi:hypothetical protein
MAIATKSSGVAGKWLDKKSLKTGDIAKIKTEATEQPSQQGGTQWVAKLHVKGQTEPLNFAINKPSKNALIDAFGEDTLKWIDIPLTLTVEKTIISGKRGIGVYLIPEGFEMTEDAGAYIVITKKGAERTRSQEEIEEDINIDDVPF